MLGAARLRVGPFRLRSPTPRGLILAALGAVRGPRSALDPFTRPPYGSCASCESNWPLFTGVSRSLNNLHRAIPSQQGEAVASGRADVEPAPAPPGGK